MKCPHCDGSGDDLITRLEAENLSLTEQVEAWKRAHDGWKALAVKNEARAEQAEKERDALAVRNKRWHEEFWAVERERQDVCLAVEHHSNSTVPVSHVVREMVAEKQAASTRVGVLEAAAREACDLLAERTYGSPARSPGHNARLRLEAALSPSQGGGEKP